MFRDPTIAGDWYQLVQRLDRAGALGHWSVAEPALAGFAGIEELAVALAPRASTDRDRVDNLIGALVRRAHLERGDDDDAVLVLVHLLSDGLHAIAGRWTDLSNDVLPILVGQLALQIRTFPLRRTRAYAANLLRDTQQACWRELRPHRTRTYRQGGDIPIDPTDEVAAQVWADREVPEPGAGIEWDLWDLFTWASRYGIATPTDLALLVELERQRGYGTAARDRVAASFGVNERTVRRRRDRALAALRAAAPDYLRGDGSADRDRETQRRAAA